MFFMQLKNFSAYNYLLLKAQLKVPSEDTLHVSRVHKRFLKLVSFFVQNLQKPYMNDFVTSLMPCGQFAILGASGPPFKTVLWFCTHVPCQGRVEGGPTVRSADHSSCLVTSTSVLKRCLGSMSFEVKMSSKKYCLYTMDGVMPQCITLAPTVQCSQLDFRMSHCSIVYRVCHNHNSIVHVKC